MESSFRQHVPEYLMEAFGLGAFMASAALFGTLLEHPASAVRRALPDPFGRRAAMGLAMGLTAVAIVHSPWGKQSGAHLNPAVSLAFFRLGRVSGRDAFFYSAFQLAGGLLGLLVAAFLLRGALAHPAVHWVVTTPGASGPAVAFATEFGMTFVLMSAVLAISASPRARYTGLAAGALVALFITFLGPLSGMSLNPARTLASGLPAGDLTAVWVYLTAPPLGMLLAAEVRVRFVRRGVPCAKLHHDNPRRCIFCLARTREARAA